MKLTELLMTSNMNWLSHVEKAVYKTNDDKNNFDCDFVRPKPGPVTIAK